MKNKTKLLILSIIASLTFTSALASCGKKGGDNGGAQSSSSVVDDSSENESSSVVDGSSENESSSVVDGSENESSSVVDSSSENESSVTVTISGDATVAEFETVTLMAVVMGAEDEATVEWSSSDDSIASVDQSGVVTAKKTGNVTITATVDGVSATHALEVTATPYMHEIEFDLDQVSIYEGEEGEVEAYVVFNGEELDSEELGLTYTWEKVSGDDVVTLVADGAVAKFTTKATGTAVYKVTTVARGYEVSKTINVTVMANDYGYKFTNDKISMAGDAYQTSLTLIADATLTIGDVIGVKNGEPTEEVLTITWATDSDVVSIEDGVITALKAGEGVITGTTSYQGENFTITLNVSVAKNQAVIEGKTICIEAITDKMDLSALAEDIKEDIKEIKIGDLTVFSGTVATGEIALTARPVKAVDLGEGKAMTIETDAAIYSLTADVYTMIINTVEELDQWQSVAADNSAAAGLCIEEQKKAVLSGYFVLGDDIEYNKKWTPILPYAVGNPSIWSTIDAGSSYVKNWVSQYGADKVIQEDWGAGLKAGFRGVFDGKGHEIKGMEIKGDYAGFIITIGFDGVVKNVAFTGVSIGAKAGIIERGGNGGFVENVYVDVAEFESGVGPEPTDTARIFSGHGKTNLSNVVINVTNCDFTGIEYVYLAHVGYVNANNVYAIDRDYIGLTTQNFEEGTGPYAFRHFDEKNDKGGKFATVEALLADETHGAIVSEFGGYWKVEEGKLYFGDLEVVAAPEKEIIVDEYKTNIDKQVTLESESFTVGSVWSMSINGGEAVDFTVEEEGKATVTVDAATLDSYQAKVVFSSAEKVISFSNVIAVTYISTAEELKAIGVGGKVVNGINIGNGAVADQHNRGYYMLSEDIDATGIEFAAGYAWTNARFKGVFDGNGKTVSNIMVGEGGIFGAVEGAVIKNVNFKNVLFYGYGTPGGVLKPNTAGSNGNGTGLNNTDQWGLYTEVLGYSANNVVVSDITMEIKEYYYTANYPGRTSLLFTLNNGQNTYKNITVDATGISLAGVLGANIDSGETYENVSIKAANYQVIAKSGGCDSDTALTEFPGDGEVKFELALIAETAVTKNGGGDALNLPVYEGDVTALGFAAGTNVITQYIENSAKAWSARTLTITNSQFDYVDIQFSLSKSIGTLCVWMPGVEGNWNVTLAGAGVNGNAPEHKILILEADGSATTDTALAANKVYTLRVYLGIGETGVSVSAFYSETESVTIYYNSVAMHGFDAVADAE